MKLTLALKAEYFDAIRDGSKTEEYRLYNDYWKRRLLSCIGFPRVFESVVLTKGYPKSNDHERRLELPWRGFKIKAITHPHFGNKEEIVFAIDVSGQALNQEGDK